MIGSATFHPIFPNRSQLLIALIFFHSGGKVSGGEEIMGMYTTAERERRVDNERA